MHAKNEVFYCFKSFHKMIITQFGAKIKILRTDNGTEYMEKTFHSYLDNHGITHQTSCVYTAAQNGVSERKNRHLLEVTRALIFAMNVPKVYWDDAVLTVAYLINRMPLWTLDFRCPIKLIQGSRTDNIPPKVFGCVCFVHKYVGGKLDPRALKCVFVGYSTTQKGYKCYHPPTRKFFVSMDVTFREEEAYFSPPSSLQGENGHMEEMTSSITPILELPTYSGQGEYEYGNSDKSYSGD